MIGLCGELRVIEGGLWVWCDWVGIGGGLGLWINELGMGEWSRGDRGFVLGSW